MPIKAVAFDIGNTLVQYDMPLNWRQLYVPALEHMGTACSLVPTCAQYDQAVTVLTKYNTRVNPRMREVGADIILGEILAVWSAPMALLQSAKESFFSFFKMSARPFPDAYTLLSWLKARGYPTGALTDVAYGMDSALAIEDLRELREHLDEILTSVDVGYRKPHTAGFEMLCQRMKVSPHQALYIGDEQKDIEGANKAGFISVLCDRKGEGFEFGQAHTVFLLEEIIYIIESQYESQYNT